MDQIAHREKKVNYFVKIHFGRISTVLWGCANPDHLRVLPPQSITV